MTTPKSTSLLLTPLVSQNDPIPRFVAVDNGRECGECHKTIASDNMIDCDKCPCYYHLSCTGLPAYELVKYTKKNLYKRKYACKKCVEKLHPADTHKIEEIINKATEEEQRRMETDLRKTNEEYKEEIERLNAKVNELKTRIEKEEEEEEEEEEARSAPPSIAPSDYEAQLRELVSSIVTEKLEEQKSAGLGEQINNRLSKIEERLTGDSAKEHKEKEHKEKEGKAAPPQKPKLQRPPLSHPPSRPPTCYSCGKPGHISINCYSRNRWPRRTGNFRYPTRKLNPRPNPRPNPVSYRYRAGIDKEVTDNERFRTIQTVGEDGRVFVTPQHLLPKFVPEPPNYYLDPSYYNPRPFNYNPRPLSYNPGPSNFYRPQHIPPMHF